MLRSLLSKLSFLKEYLVYGLMALLMATSIGWYTTGLKLTAVEQARKADGENYKAVQSEAKAQALVDKMNKEAEYAKTSKAADASYADLKREYYAAVLRHKANQDTASRFNSAVLSTSDSTGTSVETGSDPFVSVTVDDALICADNTARLVKAREWYLSTYPETSKP